MTTDANDTGTLPNASYAPVNGLEMYYAIHGTGHPVVLLHGGLLTSDLTFGPLIPKLTATRQAIAVELQGHGHTADIDREMALEYLADDVVALLDHLSIDRADLFGFSLGGLVALQLATRHPDRIGRLAIASAHYRADGYHAEILDPEQQAGSARMPTADDFQGMQDAYTRVAPDPDHFQAFAAKTSAMVEAFTGWSSDDLRAISAPTLLMVGDTDFVRLEHAMEMYELIPDSQLAVLPGTTHMDLIQRTDLVTPMVKSFLDPTT